MAITPRTHAPMSSSAATAAVTEGIGTAGAMNVGSGERWASGLAGASLALLGLPRLLGGSAGGGLLALLGGALVYRGVSGRCAAYRALGIDRSDHGATRGNLGIKVDKDVMVQAPPGRVDRLWRDLENLPRFMSHLERVEVLADNRSRWTARAPGGASIQWEAEIINERPDELIAWRSVEGSTVESAGSVRFVPAGIGATRVEVSLQYDPPGGQAAHGVAALLGADAGQQIEHDLQEFKRAVESGRLTG